MAHEIANAFRELLVIDPLLQRERLVLKVGKQLAVVLVLAREFTAPIGRSELASGAIEIASQIARVLQSFHADLFDRLKEGALSQIVGRITIDAPVEEYLQQGPPISHIELILESARLSHRFHEGDITALGAVQSLICCLSLKCVAVA